MITGESLTTHTKPMKTIHNHYSIAECIKQKNGYTLIELIVAVSIVGILSSVAIPNFSASLENAKSSNAKQFVVNAAFDCSIALVNEVNPPIVTQANAGSDVALDTYNYVENGSVIADGGKDRWTVVIDEDGVPEFPVKSAIS